MAPTARSRVSGYYRLSSGASTGKLPTINGAIHIECKILRHVVSSTAEAKVGSVFHNYQIAIPIRTLLHTLNHPQPPNPAKKDNSTDVGFVHENIHQKRSKSWDMMYYWIRDRITQLLFRIFWDKGINNHGDYPTKHHPVTHHRVVRPRYVRDTPHIIT